MPKGCMPRTAWALAGKTEPLAAPAALRLGFPTGGSLWAALNAVGNHRQLFPAKLCCYRLPRGCSGATAPPPLASSHQLFKVPPLRPLSISPQSQARHTFILWAFVPRVQTVQSGRGDFRFSPRSGSFASSQVEGGTKPPTWVARESL